MPDVLARDIAPEDKDFIRAYADRHGISQAEVIRRLVRSGIDHLRGQESDEGAEWNAMALALAELGEEDFEDRAWG